jgi:hypothetical protein
MQIVNFGHFTRQNGTGILYYSNEDGLDWYSTRASLTNWDDRGNFIDAVYGAWASVRADGVITNVEYDPSRLVPDDKTILGIDALSTDILEGMIYKDGQITAPPVPTIEEQRKAYPTLTPRQLWRAAGSVGVYKEDVLALISSSLNPDEAFALRIDLTETINFTRTYPAIDNMASLCGITPEQLDALWLWAAT